MRYLKTNEGLFTGKAEKTFSKLIQDLEKKMTDGGYEFQKESNKVFMGRSVKDIIKTADYTITEKFDNISIEYLMKVILLKEGTFDKPFIHAKVTANEVLEDGTIQTNNPHTYYVEDNPMSELIYAELSENSLTLYGLLDQCKRQILLKNKRKKTANSFYEDFPIDEIKDRLVDLSDEFGSECEVSKMKSGIGYDVDIDLNIKFRKMEREGSHYIKVDEQMDRYTKAISEINNLSKTFNSMGLTMFFDPYYLINQGSISFQLYATKFVKKRSKD